VTRAMKSSNCVGRAHRPICLSCVARLLFVIAVVLSAGEFIVGLQIMGADIERLSLRVMAEIEAKRCRARLPAQQESNRRRARRVALQRFGDGAAQGGRRHTAPGVSSAGPLGAGRFAMRESQI